MNDVIAYTKSPIEARFKMIRTQETNLGNMVADVVRNSVGTDLVLINTGSLRADSLFTVGALTQKSMLQIFPMQDYFV